MYRFYMTVISYRRNMMSYMMFYNCMNRIYLQIFQKKNFFVKLQMLEILIFS